MNLDRRQFIRVAVLASGAMVLGVACGGARRDMERLAESAGVFRPNAFITVMPDSRVLVFVEKSEMGQGILTSHAMMVADELGVDIAQVDAVSADGAKAYMTSFGMQQTGGSTSLKESWIPMRTAAASAREMLLAAAAARLGGVAQAQCKIVDGIVVHEASGSRIPIGELARAAAEQPIPKKPPLKSADQYRYIGTDMTRVDARDKVQGRSVFGIDVAVEGLLKAYVIRAPVFGARPIEVNDAAARSHPGVVDVVLYERGVAVVAQKYWQARRAAASLQVRWDDSDSRGLNTAEIRDLALEAAEGQGRRSHGAGSVSRALKDPANKTLTAVYEVPYLAHAALEPLNCTAHVRDKTVEIWAPHQAPTIAQYVAAKICGVGMDDVTCHPTMLGGGFGRKAAPDFVTDAVVVSQAVGRPVQVIWSREDDTAGGYYRPFGVVKFEGAVDAGGRATAWRGHLVSQPVVTDFSNLLAAIVPGGRAAASAAVGAFRSGLLPDFLSMEGAAKIPYAIDNQSMEFTPVQTTIPVWPWRSVGHSINGFFTESFIDELAHVASVDPFEFRRQHLHDERLLACLESAAELAQWGRKTDAGYGLGIAAHESFDSYCAIVIEAGVVDGRIDVRHVWSVIDCGTVINPDIVRQNVEGAAIFGLSAALYQRIDMVEGRIQQGNYDSYPVMRMNDAPSITVKIMHSGAEPTGVGEPGLPPIAPALGNALFAATGVRLRRTPFVDAWREAEGT